MTSGRRSFLNSQDILPFLVSVSLCTSLLVSVFLRPGKASLSLFAIIPGNFAIESFVSFFLATVVLRSVELSSKLRESVKPPLPATS